MRRIRRQAVELRGLDAAPDAYLVARLTTAFRYDRRLCQHTRW